MKEILKVLIQYMSACIGCIIVGVITLYILTKIFPSPPKIFITAVDAITQDGTVEVTCDNPQRIVSECYNTMGESVVTFWVERDVFLRPWSEIAFCNQKQQKCWNREAQLVVYNPTILEK